MVEKMRGNSFIFDYVDRLYYGCHRNKLSRKGLANDSSKQLRNKKSYY